jgi:predicted aspartyl protease
MKFPYYKFRCEGVDAFPDRKHILRPIIPIKLKKGNSEVSYLALIDSGADYCIFDAEIGKVIGLDVLDGKLLEFNGVTGEKEKAYFHKIYISVGGWEKECYCGFSIGLNKTMPYGILGQDGFFDLFKVSMDYCKEEIELKLK